MKEIRGHHIFCTTLFSGCGYDQAFSDNMQNLIDAFQKGEPFRLCEGQDAVCGSCPNREPSGGCALGSEDVQKRDSEAMAVLGLSYGQELDWTQRAALLKQVDEAGFRRVCGGCRWAKEGLCSFDLLKERLQIPGVKPGYIG